MDGTGLRIAWLFPSLAFANYWHPVLSEYTKLYPQTIVYTGEWHGFAAGFENTFQLVTVGQMQFIAAHRSKVGYSQGFIKASPAIVPHLLQFRPNVIFTTGFCIWTILAVLFKPIGRWRIVLLYEGSAPGVDYCHSPFRLFLRRILGWSADACITNSLAGQEYLTKVLNISKAKVRAQPYQVPNAQALLTQVSDPDLSLSSRRPIFLFTGQLIPRKGLRQLLEACQILQHWRYQNYTLLIAGDGPEREELQAFSRAAQLESCVQWLGWISYGQLGAYFRMADVFILPTLEDTWGMVILEAMAFGKPILCSQWAGASELVIEGENGYRFDAHDPQTIAAAMRRLIDCPELIPRMGQRSQELIATYTPEASALFLAKVTDAVIGVI
ncbi:glycosyltransferase family 4 protein [Leptolyngbya sp. NK1-12]|uniref:Glycosyltransferase family 4 protein n=1 Tax=Leptolyngbya sp. NK1-12 TaxID=2547451 RepID=A0AA96WKR4_9CYAN|nr:glycosyltransferase family 4 protein [Leptolyngbya sp. NK1-12]WNZ27682.1 glycosyltransferase family 4 protein [Leptolyngbya sp. NK1-12]